MSSDLDIGQLAQQLAGGDERFKLIAQLLSSQQKPESRDEAEEDERKRQRDERALRFLRRLNTDLARAAGACVCWGKRPSCSICAGHGGAGFRAPDEQLFFAYFGPLLRRLGLLRDADTQPEPKP